jgi:hypothetical protein
VRNSAEGNGSTNEYDFDFKITDEDHLEVSVFAPEDDSTDDYDDYEEVLLTIGDDYDVEGVGLDAGGSITLVDDDQDWIDSSGKLRTGWRITIRSLVPVTQVSGIRNQGDFLPSIHEDALDKVTRILQEHTDEIARCIKINKRHSPADVDGELPADFMVDGRIPMVNDNADGFENGPTQSQISSAGASATAAAASATAAAASATAAGVSAAAVAAAENTYVQSLNNSAAAANLADASFAPATYYGFHIYYDILRDNGSTEVRGSGVVRGSYGLRGLAWRIEDSGNSFDDHGVTFTMSANQVQVATDSKGAGTIRWMMRRFDVS